MTTTQTRSPTELRNTLYELALAKPVPDAELLDEFVRRYPEHAAAITDFAIELALDAWADDADREPEPQGTGATVAVSKAMSRFHNRLYAVQHDAPTQRAEPRQAAENPFANLSRDELRAAARRLNANNVFMMKLRDRQIDVATMTPGFQRRVAEEIKAPLDVVLAHFAGRPQITAGAHFKADEKPEAGSKQAFNEAVASCGLTPEQQSYLLSL